MDLATPFPRRSRRSDTVTIPTSRCCSKTGSALTARPRIRLAACRIVVSGVPDQMPTHDILDPGDTFCLSAGECGVGDQSHNLRTLNNDEMVDVMLRHHAAPAF